MRTIIFDEVLEGHHLEYLNHLYMGAINDLVNEYIFIVPRSFDSFREKMEWPVAKNITIELIEDEIANKCKSKSLIYSALYKSFILRRLCKKYKADNLYLIKIMGLMPFLLFFIPSTIRIRSIVYQIYLYNEKCLSRLRLMFEKIRYNMISKSPNIDKLFILNDKESAERLNAIYKTDKFYYLPDPFPNVHAENLLDLRNDLEISNKTKIFLHFGSMEARKGTLDILKSITLLEEKKDYCFIFAGKVHSEIKVDFYNLLDIAKKKVRVIVYDKFCTYELLYNLCYTSDAILTPYRLTSGSSGVIGYASFFGKPIIGPAEGLLGNLIQQYKLGVALSNIAPVDLKNTYDSLPANPTNEYYNTHRISDFINVFYQYEK